MAGETARGPRTASLADGAAALFDRGLVICDDFASPPLVRELVECVQRRRSEGQFAAARIGAESEAQRREEIRGDSTCWWAEPLYAAERALLADLEQLRVQLNREGFLGLFDLELHYAWYPPGRGYARHVDQPRGRQQRRVSVILYLNEDWDPGAGGQLRVFETGGLHAEGFHPAGFHRDIEPVAGRLVYFLTDGREHAVLPALRDRLSVSGWFRSRAP